MTAKNLSERVTEADPDSSLSLQWYGWFHVHAGEPELAIENFEKALRLGLRDPFIGMAMTGIGIAHFEARRFDLALNELQVGVERELQFPFGHPVLAACHAHLGQINQACAVLHRFRALMPQVDASNVAYLQKLEHRELVQSGLRLAGLSE